MIEVKCPEIMIGKPEFKNKKTVFLAGGITNCPDWQLEMVKLLSDTDLVLLNPRRESFDVNDHLMSRDQIMWERQHLECADAILFWFPHETLCPITLFELGKALGQGKYIFVGCHPNYKRKSDVQIRCDLTAMCDSVEELASLIKMSRSLCSKTAVKINSDSILWNVRPIIKKPNYERTVIELQWGWTAGMSETDLERLADDCPRGYDSVATDYRAVKGLRDDLNRIIEDVDATIMNKRRVELIHKENRDGLNESETIEFNSLQE